MKKIMILIISLLMAVSIFGADKKVVYVGTNAEFPPFEYLDKGEIVGFDVDLINEIAELNNFKVEWKNMSFDGLLPALQTGKIDVIIAGMAATDERKKFVNFSEIYYFSEHLIMVNSESKVPVNSFEDLKGKKVGVVLGYTSDIALSENKDIDVQRYNGAGEGVLALKAQKIDAFILDGEPAKKYVEKNKELKLVGEPVGKEECAIAVGKGNEELLKGINEALVTLKSNGKYDELVEKYFGKKE